jgi:tetratricopeptide (TPR) repeat protein
MVKGRRNSLLWRPSIIAFVSLLVLAGQGVAAGRIQPGAVMPEFALADANGVTFTYDLAQDRVLGFVVLQAGQRNFERIIADVRAQAADLRERGGAFDCLAVISGPVEHDRLSALESEKARSCRVLLDPDFKLWGKLGIVAAPTAVVVGADHRVKWVKAGYGYDFIPGLRGHLAQALGLKDQADTPEGVKTLENASARARRERHVRMAQALARKGRIELAISELNKARALDPNAVAIPLELGEFLCRTGQNEAALKIVQQTKPTTAGEQARALLIAGWARRQMGELDIAETLLLKARGLDPNSARVLYEVGKVFEVRGNLEEAVANYRRALALVFGEGQAKAASPD